MSNTIAQTEQFNQDLDKFTATSKEVSTYFNGEMIKSIDLLAKRTDRLSFQLGLQWHSLTVVKFGVPLLAGGLFLDEFVRGLIDTHEAGIKAAFELEKHALLFKGIVILLLFLLGHWIEEWISEWTIARRKQFLVRLVMNRMRALWLSYNGILMLEKLGRDQLADIEKRQAEIEKRQAEEERKRHEQDLLDAEYLSAIFPDPLDE